MTKKTINIIVLLVGLYVGCQAIADIGATKIMDIAGVTMPAGTLIFALTFTLRDLIHKRLGKEWATAAIVTAGVVNVLQAGYLAFVAKIPSAVFFSFGEAWTSIFALVPAITIGSILAEVISELVDTQVYHYWMTRFGSWPQWTRVLASNVVSLPLDSFIFGVLAFWVLPQFLGGHAMTFGQSMLAVSGQITWKAAVTVISMPLIYTVKDGKLEGVRTDS